MEDKVKSTDTKDNEVSNTDTKDNEAGGTKCCAKDNEVGEIAKLEITALRSQLDAYSKRTIDTTRFAVAFSLIIFGWAFTQSSEIYAPFIALLPMFILYPFLELILNLKANMIRIATYLRVQYSKEHPYEKLIWDFRIKMPKNWWWPSYESGTVGMLHTIGVASLGVSFILIFAPPKENTPLILYIVLVIVILYSAWLVSGERFNLLIPKKTKMGRDFEKEVFCHWKEILENPDLEQPCGNKQ